jgi:glutamate racemase
MVALDPMIKPAAEQTRSGVIAVCATPTTLASARYQDLKQEFAAGITVMEPDCSDWSYLIENNQMNEARLRTELEPALEAGADIIVLACTHYHWIHTEIERLAAGKAAILQPEAAIIRQLKRVLGLPV